MLALPSRRSSNVQLPGGIRTSEGINKDYSFKPLTGFDEMYLWDVSSTNEDRLDVTCGILNTFVELSSDAENLCVADSLYLLSRLAIELDAGFFWLSVVCGSCSAQFDVPVDMSGLPIKTAQKNYPECAEISEAIENVSPEIPLSLQSACPDCAEINDIPFDIAAHLISFFKNPFEDVHEIASAYHWTEAQILALSRPRREAYLSLIERDAGVSS